MYDSGGLYTHRAVETDIVDYVTDTLADPVRRFTLALLTGSPALGIATLLAQGVVPRLASRAPDAARRPAAVEGAWPVDAEIGYCLSEQDVPTTPPASKAAPRVLLVACTDIDALPAWATSGTTPYVRTLPIGPLSLFEAHDFIEARLGDSVDARSAATLADLAGFAPLPLAIITAESRSAGALERVDGRWRLLGDPVHLALVPYVRAQLASVSPDYARVMCNLALTEPFTLNALGEVERETAVQLLRDGELEQRSDGMIGFLAPAAAAALRILAPPEEQRRASTAAFRDDEGSPAELERAVRHGLALTPRAFERLADRAAAAEDWRSLIDLADYTEEHADRLDREHADGRTEPGASSPSALRCRIQLWSARALIHVAHIETPENALDRAERLLVRPDMSPLEAEELRRFQRVVRAEVLHLRHGNLEGALAVLSGDRSADRTSTDTPAGPSASTPVRGVESEEALLPVYSDDPEILGEAAIHLVLGGRHRDAKQILRRSDRDSGRRHVNDIDRFRGGAPDSIRTRPELRERIAVASALLRIASGKPAHALRDLTRLAGNRPPEMNGAQLRADSIRAGTVTAALQSGGPNTFNTLERRFLSTRDPGVDLGRLYAQRAAWQFFRGDVADAHRTASLALDATDTVDPSGIRAAAIATLAETSALGGDHASATAYVDQLEQEPPRASGIIAGTVQAHRAATQLLLRTPHAGEALRRAAARFHQEGQLGFAAETLYAGVRFGRRRAAADLYALADHLDGDLHRMRVEHARALLDADPVAMYTVAEELHAAGLCLYAAEVAATVLRTTDIPGSLRDRATRRVAGYLSEQPPSALIGHPLLRIPHTASHVSRLTPREREVSALIEAGLTNAEIADRLKLSLVTVEGHITRIYRKTGASRRAPARRGLS